MKRWKKILIVFSSVVVLFVSVFAVSASAINISEYVQLDPQTTLMSVDINGDILNQGLLGLPSTIIPPNNVGDAYQTYGDFSTVKYRWQAWSNGAFGVHSVSNHRTWIYQDYNYLDVRGQRAGAYDITVYGYLGNYDGNIGVERNGLSHTNLLTITLEFIRTDGGSNYQFVSETVQLNGGGTTFTLSSYLRERGYLGVYDSQRVYLKNLYVENGSGTWDDSYGGILGFETFVLMHTNNGQYWEEYSLGERDSFDPSMQSIIDNLRYHFTLSGYQNGYSEGYDIGYNSGYNIGLEQGNEEGYYTGYDEGYDIGYQFGYSSGYATGDEEGYDTGYVDGYNLAITQNQIVKEGMFGWIMNGVQSFVDFQLFDGFSIGFLLSVVVGVSCLIWLLKLLAGG